MEETKTRKIRRRTEAEIISKEGTAMIQSIQRTLNLRRKVKSLRNPKMVTIQRACSPPPEGTFIEYVGALIATPFRDGKEQHGRERGKRAHVVCYISKPEDARPWRDRTSVRAGVKWEYSILPVMKQDLVKLGLMHLLDAIPEGVPYQD